MPSTEETLADLIDAVRQLRTGRRAPLGRRSTAVAGSLSYAAATAGFVADATGPVVIVRVGPSGRLGMTASARLAITSGTTPRLSMGWTLTGPYLDEALTLPVAGVTPATVVAADAARALALGAVGEVTASHSTDAAGLVPGWYRAASAYSLTGTGTLAAAVSLRTLIAAPV